MNAPFPEPDALAANSAGPLVRFWWSRRMQFLLVAALSVLSYLPSLNFGFVYDDDAQVLQNPLLSSWHSLPTFFTHQSWSFLYPAARADYYRPVLLIWLTLNRHLFGLHPAGWHFASLCLHAAIAGLLFLLLQRHGFPSWIAFVSALYFGLHSAHIESVAWISGSTDLLACFGMLASLLLWWRSVESRSFLFFFFSLLFYFLALLSKEVSIVFPGVVFTYAWLFLASPSGNLAALRRSIANAFQKTIPFALTAFLFLLLRGLALHASHTSNIPFSFRSFLASAPSVLFFTSAISSGPRLSPCSTTFILLTLSVGIPSGFPWSSLPRCSPSSFISRIAGMTGPPSLRLPGSCSLSLPCSWSLFFRRTILSTTATSTYRASAPRSFWRLRCAASSPQLG
jgi:hypothetical protein